MAAFGDVLRGLGSVLNPQVNQALDAEERQKQALAGQVGLLQLQQQIKQQSPEYQAQMEALNNERGFRAEVQGAGGDMTKVAQAAVKFGKPEIAMSIYNRAEDRQMRLQQAKDTLEQRMQELKMRLEDRAATRDQQGMYQQMLLDMKQQAINLQGQIASGNQSLRQLQIQAMTDARQRAEAEKEDKQIEAQIGKTADRMKDVGPVFTAAKQLNNILSQYTPDNVPGIGYLKNTDIGKVALSEEGKNVASSIKLFGNAVLKAMSGAAVTPSEEIRQMAAQMADGRFSAKDFYVAWPKMAEWVSDQAALATSGLTPKARERFTERTGVKIDRIQPRFTYDGKSLKDSKESHIPPPPPGFRINP